MALRTIGGKSLTWFWFLVFGFCKRVQKRAEWDGAKHQLLTRMLTNASEKHDDDEDESRSCGHKKSDRVGGGNED